MRISSLLIVSLTCGALVASCGGDEQKESIKPQIGSVELTATRDGDNTVLSGSSPMAPRVVVPDSALPTGVSTEDLSGTVSYAINAELGMSVVQFSLGPDGTEFDEPVELAWTSNVTESSVIGIMAFSDTGENLLDADEAQALIDNMNVDEAGSGEVSIAIDHFSTWSLYQFGETFYGSGLSKEGSAFITAALELDEWSQGDVAPIAKFDLYWYAMSSLSKFSAEFCAKLDISVTGGARVDNQSYQEECSPDADNRLIYVTCDNSTSRGDVRVKFSGYYGMAGLAPFERAVVLWGSEEVKFDESDEIDENFAAASDLALFVVVNLRQSYNCADGVSTPSSTSPESTTSTLVTPTTTDTIPKPTVTSVASNTTTLAAATTTMPRASTTTSVPSWTTTTAYTSPPSAPGGSWLRNDSRCSWQGSSSCGVYSSGSSYWDVVGPAGGPGSTFAPIAGTAGQLAYNLYSGNSITNCDWNGSGGCGYYFTGTPGTLNIGALG